MHLDVYIPIWIAAIIGDIRVVMLVLLTLTLTEITGMREGKHLSANYVTKLSISWTEFGTVENCLSDESHTHFI